MQYVVKGRFGTVEEAVLVERSESMLAYCTLLQLSGISQPTIAKRWWACFLGQSFEGKGSNASVAGLVLGWVGKAGRGVSVSYLGVQLLCKGVQLRNPPKIRSTIVASLRLFY
jgi:hypothetical protein